MSHARSKKAAFRALLAGAVALAVSGCLNIKGADLFLIQRTGQGKPFSILINDSGTIACNNRAPQRLPDAMLLNARDLAAALETYVRSGQQSGISGNGVFRYRVELSDGTITFPDTAAKHQAAFAQAELFALQAAQKVCHLNV